MTELWKLDAVDVAKLIRDREVRCTEVMESVVGRIAEQNPAINAIVIDCSAEAMTAAAAADQAMAADKNVGGPLFGVPVTIKINVDVAGQPTTNGIPALAGLVAPSDSPVTRNLKGAGAIVVGRSNAPEFSMRATTDNPLYGRTFNPWGSNASAGGSSGGAGAAAAAGFGPIHHGNDIGGSLRFPAFCNGAVTIKPTTGRIASFNETAAGERGVLAALMSTQGVIARSVRDVRLGTEVLCAPDARDPWQVPVPWNNPNDTTKDGLPKVAITRNTHGYPANPEIMALLDIAENALRDAGYNVVEAEPPSIREAANGWFSVGVTELKLSLDPAIRRFGSADVQSVFDQFYELGEILDLPGYQAGLANRTRITREWSLFTEEYPIVLTPFLMEPTYPWNADLIDLATTKKAMDAGVYSFGLNFLGLPAGVLPIGLVEGLPAGVQFVGRRFTEPIVLDAMEAVEARVGSLLPQLWGRS